MTKSAKKNINFNMMIFSNNQDSYSESIVATMFNFYVQNNI